MLSRLLPAFLLAAGLFSSAAWAEQTRTIEIATNINVSRGELRTIALPGTLNVYKLLVQAESYGREGAFFDVIVNGDTKGTILTPAVDPNYIVTVMDSTSSVQFRSLSGGSFHLIRVLAVVSSEESPDARIPIGRLLPNKSQLTQIAIDAIASIREMEQTATPNEQLSYLLPIKSAAGRMYAVAAARGPYSEQSRNAVLDLIGTIDAAKPYLNQQMQKNGSFDCIVHLLALRANLDAMID